MSRSGSPAHDTGGRRVLAAGLFVTIALCLAGHVQAATLEVGPNHKFKMPSEAATAAKNGDVVEIAPGEYFDCAFWRANNLTIIGKGPEVVITDKTCGGKGLFVISGNNVTVRNLTLARARVPDGNGAGIRAEGVNLKIENSKFVNNQNGILANPAPSSTIEISDSEFLLNGSCANPGGCAHGIYVNNIARLVVARSKFLETKEGHHIKSRAARTEVIGNSIADGDKGTSSYLIEVPNGGSLVVEGNTLQKGPNCSNHGSAISIGAEGVSQRTEELTIKNNRFTNDYAGQTTFVNNITATGAKLTGNTFKGKVIPLKGDGEVR